MHIGYDDQGLDDGLKWADILVGREFSTRDFGLPPFTGFTCLVREAEHLSPLEPD